MGLCEAEHAVPDGEPRFNQRPQEKLKQRSALVTSPGRRHSLLPGAPAGEGGGGTGAGARAMVGACRCSALGILGQAGSQLGGRVIL